MNALGDRCHSVLVLVDTTHASALVIDAACGYHVGCVVPSASHSPVDIIDRVGTFFAESKVDCAQTAVSEASLHALLSSPGSVTDQLTKPVSVVDATALTSTNSLISLLTWLYGEEAPKAGDVTTEHPYTLVALLDVSRGELCPAPSSSTAAAVKDDYAWLRPTPSYYSELMEAATRSGAASGPSALPYRVFPVQMYSRYPVVRDRGLQEVAEGGVPKPVAQWTNKSTLDALLRELAFKAGQLAKYGA